MVMAPKLAADFRTRVYLEFLQVLQRTDLDAAAFQLRSSRIDPPLPPDFVYAVVTVTWLPQGLSCTYSSSRRRGWTLDFRRDIRAGRFA